MMGGSDDLDQKKQRLEISRNNHGSVFASSASNCFPGSRAILNFGASSGLNQPGNLFELEETGNDYFDEYLTQPEKKRRLSIDQVQFLERSFVEDNRLEPERKIQLAKELNLQPRQIAIWFQNRRARWRNKQLETDYETLHMSFVNLKNEYDKVVEENEKLKSEVLRLKHDGPMNDTEKSSDLQFSADEVYPADMTKDAVAGMVCSEDEEFKELTLAKSDVSDVESPRMADAAHLTGLKPGEPYGVFEFVQSDTSQNGEDEFLETFDNFSKSEDGFCEESDNSFYNGFQVEDPPVNFWPYQV